MNIVNKIIGARSKYDKQIPYTYEARVYAVKKGDEPYYSCFSDTICGLINYLQENELSPNELMLLEIYHGKDKEKEVPEECYMTDQGDWLPKELLCKVMTSRYGEPKTEHNCQFRDRDKKL